MNERITELQHELGRLGSQLTALQREIEATETALALAESDYCRERWGVAYGDKLAMTPECEAIFREDNQRHWIGRYRECTFQFSTSNVTEGDIRCASGGRGGIPMAVIAGMRAAWLREHGE